MWLQYFKQLYSLDTLDTRFIVPATAPPKEALEEARLINAEKILPVQNGRFKDRKPAEDSRPSKWQTPEFSVYFLIIAVCLPLMVKSVYDVSQGQCRDYMDIIRTIC
jgi:hypothetical protein